MSDEEYVNFRTLFDRFHGKRSFDFAFFVDKHLEFVEYLQRLQRKVPTGMETAHEALQLLYDAGIIGYKEPVTTKAGNESLLYHWSYKERNYANMRPTIRPNGDYIFHLAYAHAFGLI